jgi:hypothetical protein
MRRYYRFEFRTLTDPEETRSVEQGPFSPSDAAVFGQMETARYAINSGRNWVCHYQAVPRNITGRLISVALGILLGLLIWRWLR